MAKCKIAEVQPGFASGKEQQDQAADDPSFTSPKPTTCNLKKQRSIEVPKRVAGQSFRARVVTTELDEISENSRNNKEDSHFRSSSITTQSRLRGASPSKDAFFEDLVKKGSKMDKLPILEDLKIQHELKDCTF